MKNYKRLFDLLFGLTFLLTSYTSYAQKIFNIKDHGAKSNDTTINTIAIQKTIDACAEKGGGTVLIPNGTFLSGTIFLKSNVALMLSPAAVLKGSVNMKDYNGRSQLEREGFICASGQTNIGIYGTGTINGWYLTIPKEIYCLCCCHDKRLLVGLGN